MRLNGLIDLFLIQIPNHQGMIIACGNHNIIVIGNNLTNGSSMSLKLITLDTFSVPQTYHAIHSSRHQPAIFQITETGDPFVVAVLFVEQLFYEFLLF